MDLHRWFINFHNWIMGLHNWIYGDSWFELRSSISFDLWRSIIHNSIHGALQFAVMELQTICGSVGAKRRTHRTFPMARPKCLMGNFPNLYRIYKAHQTHVWWTMKVFLPTLLWRSIIHMMKLHNIHTYYYGAPWLKCRRSFIISWVAP